MFFEVDTKAVSYLLIPFLLSIYYLRFHNRSFPLLISTLIVKICLSFLLLYFVINRWDFGDLPTYYILAHYLKDSELEIMYGSLFVAQLHSIIFIIFGTSLYGITLLSACISHLAFTLMAEKIYEHSEIRNKNNAIFWINILPVLSMQSTYIGREPWILLITAILFYFLDNKILNKLIVLLLLSFVFLTRSYHGAILGASFGLALLFYYGIINLRILLLVILSLPIIYAITLKLLPLLGMINESGIALFLSVSYEGGNQIFQPYPFPFTFLQLFRPMPWDSVEPFMVLASLENMFVFILAIRLTWSIVKNPFTLTNCHVCLIFMFLFTSIYGGLFMFSENVGDLSRRHVYFYPFIILAYFKCNKPILKTRFGKKLFT